MKRIISNPATALLLGLCLRLFFVLRFPGNSGDTVLYEQIAANWLKHHAYAMDVAGAVTLVDLRMPGYPAFLTFVYALSGRTEAAARFWVMLAQVFVDLSTCVVIARLAQILGSRSRETPRRNLAFTVGLWLAVTCPFTANYTAVPLTEVWATFFTAVALLFLVRQLRHLEQPATNISNPPDSSWRAARFTGIAAAFTVGFGTLFRPETPLILIAAWMVLYWFLARRQQRLRWFRLVLVMAFASFLPLIPWGARNFLSLHEWQFLAPRNSNLPGELVPQGFMAWEKTWLYRVRDCYLVSWKLNNEPIDVNDIPPRAFDTPQEKERVAQLLARHNEDLTLTPEEDAGFAQLGRERTRRHPLGTYLWLPAARALTIWFTPRIELLPFSGKVLPLAQAWEDDPIDQSVTIGFFVLNIFYVALAAIGALLLWRSNSLARPAIALLVLFVFLRTAFLTTLETPEPRYVLECFPAVLALGAQVFRRPSPSVPCVSI
ncbi:MAG TPA: hypothetical protein VOA64_02825 [Candidatus Dormibacteraeota bacterium]|nr:hypothetical protein [Candidatus Dormibacteraeota bacterium]